MMKKHSRALSLAVAALMLTACSGSDDPIRNAPPAPQGDTVAITSDSNGFNLITFNRATPGTIATSMRIDGITPGETVVGADIRATNGQYYVVTNAPAVYIVSRTTGQATSRVALTAATDGMPITFDAGANTFGVDFNPVPDRLRLTTNTGQNFRINVDAATNNTIVDGSLALDMAPFGVDEVAYSNTFARTCRTTLFYIDTVTDQLLTTTQPNDGVLTAVGPLGVDASGASGFEIISSLDPATGAAVNNAIATLTVGGSPVLYSIDLMSGAATAIGGVGSAGPVVGLSVLPQTPAGPPGDIVAVDTSNNIVSFLSTNPGLLCTSVPVNGLAMGENLLDVDVRPANGLLYGLGSQSNLYIIDPTSGAATMPQTLNPIGLDATEGATFGIDFNPVPDRLRIVSSFGQNLRVNVDNGLVANGPSMMPGDGPINGVPGASITAVAYTNSISGATQTTLFDIDTGNDQLTIQQPPNDGTLMPVGPLMAVDPATMLAADVASAGGFDINGLTNEAFAAFNLMGVASSVLYTVDLTSGATTPVGTIGGGAPVRGMALLNPATQASTATVVAVTSGNNVVTFSPSSPDTFITSMPITGLLNGSETIVGIDQRPANRLIYAVTDANQLYTLDQTTGVATPVGPLVADPTDADNPFVALNGTLFGVDVNPVVDRLRVASNAVGAPPVNNNLRINMDPVMGNVNTITDVDVSRVIDDVNVGMPIALSDVGYTNSRANAPSTMLFGLDMGVQSLVRFTNANAGTLQTVGPFMGMTMFTGTGAFDIFGGGNATIVALQPAGMMAQQSQLFTINLATGAITNQPAMGSNAIGPAGTVVTAATVIFTP